MNHSFKERVLKQGRGITVTVEELRRKIKDSSYGPETKRLLKKWIKYESIGEPGFGIYEKGPPIMEYGSGASLYDADGEEWIDCLAGFSVNNVGICNPEVIKAIEEQLKKLIQYYDFPSVPRIKLSENLVNITPGDFPKKVIYGVTGSEAVETAIQIARWYTEKPFILVPYGDYHGRTPGTMGMTSKAIMWKYYYPVPPHDTAIAYFPYPYCYRCPYDKEYPSCDFYCIKGLENLFNSSQTPFFDVQNGISNVAGIIIEPMQASAGYIIPPEEYLAKLQKVCGKYGILLIVDEVQSGMGRSGKMWACEHSKVTPDILCFGKSLGGGLPISGIVGRTEIMDSWGPVAHLGTFAGTVLACAAGNKVLEIIQKKKICELAAENGEYFLKGLKHLAKKHLIVGDVQGKGFFIGVEFVRNRKTKEPAKKESLFMMNECLKERLIFALSGWYNNRFTLIPPLVISKKQIDRCLDILNRVFGKTENKFGIT